MAVTVEGVKAVVSNEINSGSPELQGKTSICAHSPDVEEEFCRVVKEKELLCV